MVIASNVKNALADTTSIKSIALIHRNMEYGGIETLIVRMVKWLCDNEFDVTLFLFSKGGPLLEQLEGVPNLKIVAYENKLDSRFNSRFMTKLVSMKFKDKFDFIYSFSPTSFLLSYMLPGNNRLSGVYHPETYHKDYMESLKRTLKLLDKDYYSKLVFMTPSVKIKTAERFKEPLNDYIFPLPIDLYEVEDNYGNYKSRRIVSIGRLTDFKTYNFYMVDIMERLIQVDPTFTYHIYGYGEDEEKLRERVNASSAKDHIFLHGKLKYEDIGKVMKDTFCFVGMGSSLIEACGYGVPGIAAKINDWDAITEGYFHQLPAYECGDTFRDEFNVYKVEDLILQLMINPKEKYDQIANQCKEKIKEFESDSVMENFIRLAESQKGRN
ncbi:glycosyltransferase [Planococcus sp. YIM B11945]|uniref:glycosyltransferase n=1 Tax=Planococcus sp. YIM B11945 TaxID=3435410 RepID=UPI003D7EEA31